MAVELQAAFAANQKPVLPHLRALIQEEHRRGQPFEAAGTARREKGRCTRARSLLSQIDALQLKLYRRKRCVTQHLSRQIVQFRWLGRHHLQHAHHGGIRVMDEVDMIIFATDDQRAPRSDPRLPRGSSQRRGDTGIHVRQF